MIHQYLYLLIIAVFKIWQIPYIIRVIMLHNFISNHKIIFIHAGVYKPFASLEITIDGRLVRDPRFTGR